MKFKERYIEQFNAMEAELRNRQPAIPQDYAAALRYAADEYEKRVAAEQTVEDQNRVITGTFINGREAHTLTFL